MTANNPAAQTGARNMGVDLLRAICILYIVGFWHLMNYTHPMPGYVNWFTEGLTYVAMATFVFCSGFLLAGQAVKPDALGLWSFYRRRLVRIYPLYLVAVLLFAVAGIASLEQTIDGVLLISMFEPPALPTLWFVTMIMVFYLIAPLPIYFASRPKIAILSAAAIFLALIAIYLWVKQIEPRIILYFPVFVLGIFYRRQPAIGAWLTRYQWWLLGVALILLRLSWTANIWSLSGALLAIPLTLTGATALFVFADRIARPLHRATIAFFAYASFGLYLFHRLVFKWAVALYLPTDGWDQIIYLAAAVLPIAILVGWGMQLGYDRLLARSSPAAK
jgi:peptidoglycan/LPS O-acetylase OafA/YrhL